MALSGLGINFHSKRRRLICVTYLITNTEHFINYELFVRLKWLFLVNTGTVKSLSSSVHRILKQRFCIRIIPFGIDTWFYKDLCRQFIHIFLSTRMEVVNLSSWPERKILLNREVSEGLFSRSVY